MNTAGFTTTNLCFGTCETGKTSFGSVYFSNGRIRLFHRRYGPAVITHTQISRFMASEADIDDYYIWLNAATLERISGNAALEAALDAVVNGRSHDDPDVLRDVAEFLKRHEHLVTYEQKIARLTERGCPVAALPGTGTLIEIVDTTTHKSRGIPSKIYNAPTQTELDGLVAEISGYPAEEDAETKNGRLRTYLNTNWELKDKLGY